MSATNKITMVQAINLALEQEMKKNDRIVVMGEDVGVDGGVFRVTDGLVQKYGESRVIDTPLAESGIVGTAMGMAMAGMRPVCEMQFCGFSYIAIPQIEGNISRIRSRSQGVWTSPMVIRIPYGGGIRALEHHSESPEATFAHLPGVKVVVPSGPRNARALLVSALRDPDPVIYLEPKRSYRAFKEEVPVAEETIEIGKAHLAREGKTLTVVTWGATMRPVLQAADILKAKGIDIEIIDLLTISPLDAPTIVASVRKTGRCVVAHEGRRSFGVAAEIIARVNEEALLYLEAPIRRVGGWDVITPYFGRENMYLPEASYIAKEIEETLKF